MKQNAQQTTDGVLRYSVYYLAKPSVIFDVMSLD